MMSDMNIRFTQSDLVYKFLIGMNEGKDVGSAVIWKDDEFFWWEVSGAQGLLSDFGRTSTADEAMDEILNWAVRKFEPDNIQTPDQATMQRIEKSETIQS